MPPDHSHRPPACPTRTWHLQLAVFWIATCWLATGLYLGPKLAGREPRAVSVAPRQVRVPRSYELQTLAFQHDANRGGAGGDHELAEVGADHVSERELHDGFDAVKELKLNAATTKDALDSANGQLHDLKTRTERADVTSAVTQQALDSANGQLSRLLRNPRRGSTR